MFEPIRREKIASQSTMRFDFHKSQLRKMPDATRSRSRGEGTNEQGDESLDPEARPWDEAEQDAHVRSLYKAEKLLGDVLFRLNLFTLSAQHYAYLNNACFVTPSIIITSIASFLSFMAATDPAHSKDISLSVGFLGTVATIVTALQSAYKFDTMSETFRTAAAEYRLLNTRVVSVMRKEKVYPEEWELLWDEIETRMTELQKKLNVHPNRELIDGWAREGKLSEKTMSGSMMPPWLIRFQEDLEEDGIQEEQDIKFISDEVFEMWEEPIYETDPESKKSVIMNDIEMGGGRPRYPTVVLAKLKEKRNVLVKLSSSKKVASDVKINMKATTLAALRKRGIVFMSDFRLATDDILDSVIDELIQMDTPPMPIAWARLEETVAETQRYGFVNPMFKFWCPITPSGKAQERMSRVCETSAALAKMEAAKFARNSRASRSSFAVAPKFSKNK